MSIDSLQRTIQNHQKELARLQLAKSKAAAQAAEETKRAEAVAEAAGKTNSSSTRQSKLREVQRRREAAVQQQKKVADLEAKIAQEQDRINDAQKRLAAAQDEAAKKRSQAQARAEREHERRMKAITGTLTYHGELHQVALSAIEKLQRLPKQITVLFFAANPLDQQQLRLDEEVRSIGDMIRKSQHRDAVRLESRWAVRPLDVLQAINECEPRIIHFSGHGSDQDEIVFQDNAGQTKLVTKEALVQMLVAGSDEIQLVFFNTCYSRGQAEAVVQHVPAAIGMNTAIGDDAARVFASQFYSAIGFGLSVGRAFQQAKAALMVESIPEENTPELFVTDGLNADDLVLVQPEKNG